MILKKKAKKGFKRKLKRRKSKKRKKHQKTNKNALPEVDKQLYEIQISDLGDKLETLKEKYSALEAENEDVRLKLEQVDDDRADVIAYLKRTLQNKLDEVNELQERMRALQMSRNNERAEFDEQYASIKQEYELKLKNVSSELHAAHEKLKTLEEFRLQREDLLKKFEEQQRIIDGQEDLHKQAIRSVENEYALKKIRMKKEVDERLLQLSGDLQAVIQMKIDATTKITMNENYSLNKEIDKIMSKCKKLINENEQLKAQASTFRNKLSIIKDGMNLSLQTNSNLKKELKTVMCENIEFKSIIRENVQLKHRINDLLLDRDRYRKQLDGKCRENEKLFNETKSNEKKLKFRKSDKCNLESRLYHLENVLKTARNAIREMLQQNPIKKCDGSIDDNSFVVMLLNILETGNVVDEENRNEICATNADDNKASSSGLLVVEYNTGKLGIIPKNCDNAYQT